MIDQIAEPFFAWISFALLAGWRTVPVFIVVAIATLVIRNRAPARYLCWLWIIVIARLFLPVSATSSLSISSLGDASVLALLESPPPPEPTDRGFDLFTYEGEDGKPITIAMHHDDATPEERARADAYVAELMSDQQALRLESESQTSPVPTSTNQTVSETSERFLEAFTYLVALGLPAIAITLLLRGVFAHVRLSWKLWALPEIVDQSVIDCALRAGDDLGVGRRPKLKEVPWFQSPAVFGLFRPIVCLPPDWKTSLTEEQLGWVLRHELSHIKSRDGLVLFVATIARSLHWFNPLSWIAVTNLRNNMERAADELATRHLTDSKLKEYGELLIRYAADRTPNSHPAAIGLLAMALPNGLHGRVLSLARTPGNRQSDTFGWLRHLAIAPALITFPTPTP
ncbi:MAG: M56 family metallopeptidase [Planctomycetota bacterium]